MSVTLQQPSFKILFLGICRIQNCNIAGMMQDKKRKVQSELIQVCNQAWSWYFERCVLKLIFQKCFLYISLTLFKELDTLLQSIVPFLTSCGILLDAGSASVKWHFSKFIYKTLFLLLFLRLKMHKEEGNLQFLKQTSSECTSANSLTKARLELNFQFCSTRISIHSEIQFYLWWW